MSEVPGTCRLLATLGGDAENASGGIAVIDLSLPTPRLERVAATPTAAVGLVLTKDRRFAVVAGSDRIYVFEVAALLGGRAAPPAAIQYAENPGTVSVALTPDERLLFASDEGIGKIRVLDFYAMRRSGFDQAKVLSTIPVDYAPTVLAASPDGRRIYVPVEGISRRFNPPILCRSEGGNDPTPVNQVGGILTIDTALAISDPERAVIGRTPAGCSPVRLSLTPDGRTLWVTNRLGDTVRGFDTSKLVADPARAELAIVNVGHQPIGVALLRSGKIVAVANASRWVPDQTRRQTVSAFAAEPALRGKAQVRTIGVGIFPRDLAASRDGEILYVSNFGSKSLEIIPARELLRPR